MKTTSEPRPPKINMAKVIKAVKDRETSLSNRIIKKPSVKSKSRPVDIGRRGTMKPKGDSYLFEGILTGGVMCHD